MSSQRQSLLRSWHVQQLLPQPRENKVRHKLLASKPYEICQKDVQVLLREEQQIIKNYFQHFKID